MAFAAAPLQAWCCHRCFIAGHWLVTGGLSSFCNVFGDAHFDDLPQFILEGVGAAGCGVKADVGLPGREMHQFAVEDERRYLVADLFVRVGRGGADPRAQRFEHGVRFRGKGGDIGIDRLEASCALFIGVLLRDIG
jgi:hypothetical protein